MQIGTSDRNVVASPKCMWGKKFGGGGKFFYFRRATVFSLGYHLSKHKI